MPGRQPVSKPAATPVVVLTPVMVGRAPTTKVDYAQLASKMGLVKLSTFDGTHAGWPELLFRVQDLVGIYRFDKWMKMAEDVPGDMTLANSSEEIQESSRCLWSCLVSACRGRASLLIRLIEPGNGYAAWRCLV
jgi:hypothetical protein